MNMNIQIAYTKDETLVLVESPWPLPDLPTVRHLLPDELQALDLLAYIPGGVAGSTAAFSDMWVLSAA